MYDEIITFWFEEVEESQYWQKDEAFDQLIAQRFSAIHQQASQGELYGWRKSAEGRLAEIIVLDQFSRNIYRDSPQSFSNDALALGLAQEAISLGLDKELSAAMRGFLYLPFMHSESAAIHHLAVALYTELGMKSNLQFELRHKAIIDRFGRYPHRNDVLGRASTAEEVAFLQEPGSSF
ncbi:uncharacterized protein (DUF924 family) [Sinobacterium caligoides]|uniref:Uncharacterized protein (DUF924 family) n=1 Tax=Sinobacterium caligoides TaxID=933926 RepID=A0A3N2DMM9_9GAMM|nr:DUF924 family protein [Sinobacterium caligoides]ROS01063.1 uncharacterized protein (DUF924 family) [Sinobacterium caligoides]